MTDIERGILLLIKSAITGEKYDMPEGFDLETAAARMGKQSMRSLCFLGAEKCELLQEGKLQDSLADGYILDMCSNQQQMLLLGELFQAFAENGIHYMPLKGTIMKQLYPSPEMRTMGDADILIHTEDREKLAVIMQDLGFTFYSESDHEWNWLKKGMEVELHKRLVSADDKDYYQYFGDGWSWAKEHDGCRWRMSPEDSFIFDFTHFAKHYCRSGVRVRHIVDLWLHLRHNRQMDQIYIRNQLSQMRLERFYDNVMRMIDAWFSGGAWDEQLEFMSDYIFSGGVSNAVSTQARAAYRTGSQKSGKFGLILGRMFPDRKHLDWNYPSLKKVPLLFAWVARWFMLLTSRRDSVKKRSQQMKDVTSESVNAHRQGLEYVGLQFPE